VVPTSEVWTVVVVIGLSGVAQATPVSTMANIDARRMDTTIIACVPPRGSASRRSSLIANLRTLERAAHAARCPPVGSHHDP